MAVTAAGLPVVPGAWWCAEDQRFACDRPGCGRFGPHPVPALFAGPTAAGGLLSGAVREPQEAAARWRQGPYAVLLPTGETCDVVDVPARLGRMALARLEQRSGAARPRAQVGPVIVAGPRWFFLTAAGGELPSPAGDVLVHGLGSWIVLPPSSGPGGRPAAWVVRPRGRGWARAGALPLRDEVIRALNTAARPDLRRLPPVLPRTREPLPAA